MKKILSGISILCLFVACSQNEEARSQKVWEKTAFVAVNTNTDAASIATEKGNSKDGFIYDSISYKFTQGSQMPAFATEADMFAYVKANPSKTYGTLQLYLDGDLVYNVSIVAGVQSQGPVAVTSGKKYPCTYHGIRQCAVEGIHSQNWLQMTMCVEAGFGCVALFYANCTIDNC